MSAPKYALGDKLPGGMTIVAVIERGETVEPAYRIDGIEGEVVESRVDAIVAAEQTVEHLEQPDANI